MTDTLRIVRSFVYRLQLTKKQHAVLSTILESQRILYNAALESRVDCYRKTGKTLSYMTQCKQLTELRSDPAFAAIPANLQRWTLFAVDRAYKSFFRRLAAGEKPGFPRFKSQRRWRSFGLAAWNSVKIGGNRMYIKGIPGTIRLNLHRELPAGLPLSCSFTRDSKGWRISLQYRIERTLLPSTGKSIGIDVGLSSLCTLSTGSEIANPRHGKRRADQLRIRSRALSRCKPGSGRRKKVKKLVAQTHERIRNARRTYLHQISAKVIRQYDLIAVEALNVQGLCRTRLAKSFSDAGLGELRLMLAYKAESAGRQFIEVDPRDTTQACSGCGCLVPKTLKDRWHSCPHCGLEMDRDHNAAINILRKGVLALGQRNAAGCGKRVAGNLKRSARAA